MSADEAAVKVSREELADGVILITETRAKPLEYVYSVENEVLESESSPLCFAICSISLQYIFRHFYNE